MSNGLSKQVKFFEEDKRGAIVRLPGPQGLSDLVQALEFFFSFCVSVCVCVFCFWWFLVGPLKLAGRGGDDACGASLPTRRWR